MSPFRKRLSITAVALLFLAIFAATGYLLILNRHCDFTDHSSPAPLRVACLGDSITFGAELKTPQQESYPAQLKTLLSSDWEVRNYGVNGATLLRDGNVPYHKRCILKKLKEYQPTHIIIMLGTNDTKPVNAHYLDNYSRDYRTLLAELNSLASAPHIWLAYPPPAFSDYIGISDTLIKEKIIPAIEHLGQTENLPTLDLHTPLNNPKLFSDTLHPTAQGAKIIAEKVAENLLRHTTLNSTNLEYAPPSNVQHPAK